MVAMRRNTALWGQVMAGAIAALFVASASIRPFSPVSAVLGLITTCAVVLALGTLAFELAMLPFNASGLRGSVPAPALPWAGVGLVATVSVLSNFLGRGLPADAAIRLIQWTAPVAMLASVALAMRGSRRDRAA